MTDEPRDEVVATRIPRAIAERLKAVTDKDRNPFAPSRSRIFRRGIELALKEYEAKEKQG